MKFSSPKKGSRNVDATAKCTSFLGHLGLISGVFQELEVDKLIDEKLPKKRDHKVSHSIGILAMVINGLGFMGQCLYLFPSFFKNISTERLLGEDVTREDLNQYAVGEILDRVSEYDPTKLFMDYRSSCNESPTDFLSPFTH